MRGECVPPGKARGGSGSGEERGSKVPILQHLEGGQAGEFAGETSLGVTYEERLAARRAAVLEGCGEVCETPTP